MHKGFFLKELRVVGRGVRPAIITFSKGINVLQGASDTGKSYVFNCINYVLGGSKEPDKIKEAEGYDEIRLNICTYDEKEFTLCRKFGDSKIYVAESSMDDYDRSQTKQLSFKHNPLSEDTISYFLLNLIGLSGKKLRKNARNEKREISFRDIANLCLINEELIISKISPICSGQYTEKTVEDAVFKLILSGKDDDELESIEDPKIYRSKLRGKIEFIEESITNKSKNLNELSKQLEDLEIEKINLMIDEFTKLINESHQTVMEEGTKRENIWKEIGSLKSQIMQIDELEKRFNLLNRHYKSDIDRLEFINEGKQYIEQLQDINCPICGSKTSQQILDDYEEISSEKIMESLVSESNNIKLKQKELFDTLEQLKNQKQELNNQLLSKTTEYQTIDKYIANKLKPISDINRKKLEEYLKLKENKSRIYILTEEINTLAKEKIYFNSKLEEKDKRVAGRTVPNDLYNIFSDEIKNLLMEWGTSCQAVYYDKTANDIVIDGKPRGYFGKGFRAIFQSAFMIGLMNYCLNNNKFHPFFLILDSPLTAYKEKDETADSDSERVSEDVQNLFYKNLSKYDKNSDLQIFIIENKDPEDGIKGKITYEHFSRNRDIVRYGFFPENKTVKNL